MSAEFLSLNFYTVSKTVHQCSFIGPPCRYMHNEFLMAIFHEMGKQICSWKVRERNENAQCIYRLIVKVMKMYCHWLYNVVLLRLNVFVCRFYFTVSRCHVLLTYLLSQIAQLDREKHEVVSLLHEVCLKRLAQHEIKLK